MKLQEILEALLPPMHSAVHLFKPKDKEKAKEQEKEKDKNPKKASAKSK